MDTGKTIRKILFLAMWLVICAGILTLLIAAMGKQKRNTCKDYTITIRGGDDEKYFLGKADIAKLLKASTKGNIKGQPKSSFNLLRMEALLEDNVWVKDAQLYFDNTDVLHVNVIERKPVARVFTASGKSFYMDDEGQVMQLTGRRNAKLPVFTGFPDKRTKTQRDSVLVQDLRTTAQLINNDPFWASQVAQVDMALSAVDGYWEFEMVPVIGNHVVKLGDGTNMEQKLNNLFAFYKQVLSRTGFEKYKTIDVRFKGQVVGAKSENPKVDSVQLRKNVENMLQQIKKIEADVEAIEESLHDSASLKQVTAANPDSNPNPIENNPVNPKPAGGKPTPKAVMKRKD